MSKTAFSRSADFHEEVADITKEIMSLGASMHQVDCFQRDHTYFAVYEKYYMRAGNRVSLSILIYDHEETVFVEAITAAGGQGAVFKMSWGSEEDLLSDFSILMRKRGYREVQP